ncbi:MAG TPA: phytanoyl-CoA dioxygenase family protein [Noviherbaspirillum sp.]
MLQDKTPEEIAQLAPYCDAAVFDLAIYRSVGLFVLRNLFPAETVARWQVSWNVFYSDQLAGKRKVGFNKVNVEEVLPEELHDIYRAPQLLDVARQIFGEHVGLYNHRFVIKDEFSRDDVFLHQDICYHFGFMDKASFFTPLSVSGAENGGMEFFLGTHQYGYLGDAGEIDLSKFPAWPLLIPEVKPGDLVIMNSCLWHRSGRHLGGADRILADTILQPARDPSTRKVIHGNQGPVNLIDRSGDLNFFKRSRVTRMKELTAELERLKAKM